jgi:hypothetical protein
VLKNPDVTGRERQGWEPIFGGAVENAPPPQCSRSYWRRNNRRTGMKTYLATAALVIFAGTSMAVAQDTVIVPTDSQTTIVAPETTGSTTVIAPEREKVIREYIHKKPLASISLLGLDLSIGSTLPDTVELHQVEVPDVQYEYTVVNDHTVLVDPSTRRIVQVIN